MSSEAYWYDRVRTIRINDCGISFRGVSHDKTTFAEGAREIERDISSSPFIFLEYFDERFFETALRMVQGENFRSAVRRAHESVGFFSGVASIAATKGKDIIVVNPQDQWLDWWVKFVPCRDLAIGSIATVAASALARKNVPRRNFLLGAASAMTAVSAANAISNLSETVENEKDLSLLGNEQGVKNLDPDMLQPTSWDWRNWRDASSAVGTRAAMDAYKNEWKGKNVSMFYGALHREMLPYIQDIETAKRRRLLYPQFALSANNNIRRYHFNGKGWQVSKIPY